MAQYSRVTIKGNIYNSSNGNLVGYILHKERYTFYKTATIQVPIEYESSIANGDAVVITEGDSTETDRTIFRGTVEYLQPEGTRLIVTAYDKLFQLKYKFANVGYTDTDVFGGRFDLILTDLIETFGELDMYSIVDLSAREKLQKLICINIPVEDRVRELLKVFDLIMYYDDENDGVVIEYNKSNTYGTAFVSGTNIIDTPQWTVDTEHAYNYIEITGGKMLARATQNFVGDGVTVNYTLTYVPIDTDITVNGIVMVIGKLYTTSAYDYTVDNDPVIKQVQFVAGSTPGLGKAIVVNYSYNTPIDVVAEDTHSEGKLTIRQKRIIKQELLQVLDAENMAYGLLAKYKDGFTTVEFKAYNITTQPRIGQLGNINDLASSKNLTGPFTLLEYTFPQGITKINLGEAYEDIENYAMSVNERIKRLEEENSNNANLIRRTITPTCILDLSVTQWVTIASVDTSSYWGLTTWGGGTWEYCKGWGDDFTADLLSRNWTTSGGSWALDTNRHSYIQSSTSGVAYSLWNYTTNKTFTDIELDCKVKYQTIQNVGLLLRYDTGTGSGYCVRFKDSTKIELGLMASGDWDSQLVEGTYANQNCLWYFMKVLNYMNHFIISVSTDGLTYTDVINTTDSTYSSGSVGLITFSCWGEFTKFNVWNVAGAKL